ncbi:MAG: DUF5131 family protein [Candidatus Methanomethylophilaceae archaeon]
MNGTSCMIIRNTVSWNPWHGCRKVSRGCLNCYMYEGDRCRGVPGSSTVRRSSTQFDRPIRRNRNGRYVLNDVLVMTSMTSDFFIEEADVWRDEAWRVISMRKDLTFEILTKRPERIMESLPKDWGDGYPNVRMSVSAEDQEAWDIRVPILMSVPARKRDVFVAPMIGRIDGDKLLSEGRIDAVFAGGEYGRGEVRPCDIEWVSSLRESCVSNGVTFIWRNCGTLLVRDGVMSRYDSLAEQGVVCSSAGMDYIVDPILPKRAAEQTRLF